MDRTAYEVSGERANRQVVAFLRTRRGPSTVADLVAGTGLAKLDVEQAMRSVVHEYAGHLQVSESGELAYYFPTGMRSTLHGFWPSLRRGLRAFARGAAKVLTLLFKIWIVAMLVGYFVLFVALVLAAMLASFAASASSKGRSRRRSDGGMGFFLVLRLLDFALRMWFWSNLAGARRPRREPGRPLYQSAFAFAFGEPDPNRGYDEALRKHAIAFLRSRRGLISLEEAMAMTGLDAPAAESLLNRWAVEFEGEPGVSDEGTLFWWFPELLRTSRAEQQSFTPPGQPPVRVPRPFSANQPRTNGWIAFFNGVNLLFGGYFLFVSLAPPVAEGFGQGFTFLYQTALGFASWLTGDPVTLLATVLGAVPLAFSLLFYLVAAIRQARLRRANETVRIEGLARRIFSHILANPSRVDPREVRPLGGAADPRGFEKVRQRIFDRFAGVLGAEPEALEDGGFAYQFPELMRGQADLAACRAAVNLGKYEIGKTVFDSGR